MLKWIGVLASFFISCAFADAVPTTAPAAPVPAAAAQEVAAINQSLTKPVVVVKHKHHVAYDRNRLTWAQLTAHFALTRDYHLYPVQQQVGWWLAHRKFLSHALLDARPYVAYIYQQTQEKKLPAELALLPAVESSYNPMAYSPMGACGMWQLLPGTATDFGMRIDWWYDARRDTVASTEVALMYLGRLHYRFHNWLLALAAYNAGVGRVEAAQENSVEKNFWNLNLPAETEDYVPRLLALAYLIQHAKQYHLVLPQLSDANSFRVVTISRQMDLAEISHLSGVSVSKLKLLNAAMRRWATEPVDEYPLLLPLTAVPRFMANLERRHQNYNMQWQYHEVQLGETIYTIAQTYHIDPNLLEIANALPAHPRLYLGQGIVVPLTART